MYVQHVSTGSRRQLHSSAGVYSAGAVCVGYVTHYVCHFTRLRYLVGLGQNKSLPTCNVQLKYVHRDHVCRSALFWRG